MKFDYPSWAEDYEFIVMVKNTDEDSYSMWSVETNGFVAESAAKDAESTGLDVMVLHNVRIQGRRKKI